LEREGWTCFYPNLNTTFSTLADCTHKLKSYLDSIRETLKKGGFGGEVG
jgi:hypothetical protein